MRRRLAATTVVALALGLGACGGDEEAEVGACIDAGQRVVDCGSDEATMELVSDQEEEDAIACLMIEEPPEEPVTVDGREFCAQPLEG